MLHILNPKFKYTPSYSTDIKKTFAKERHRQERQEYSERTQRALNEVQEPRKLNVVPIK